MTAMWRTRRRLGGFILLDYRRHAAFLAAKPLAMAA
jgi:hypothetical protein